jgi:hypothetical protein
MAYLRFGIADKTNWSHAFAQRERITDPDQLKQGRLYIELTGQYLRIKALESLLLIGKKANGHYGWGPNTPKSVISLSFCLNISVYP